MLWQSLNKYQVLAGAGMIAVTRKGATAGARAVINNVVNKAAYKAGETASNKALKEATEDLVQAHVLLLVNNKLKIISMYGKKGITKRYKLVV